MVVAAKSATSRPDSRLTAPPWRVSQGRGGPQRWWNTDAALTTANL